MFYGMPKRKRHVCKIARTRYDDSKDEITVRLNAVQVVTCI